VGEHDRDAGVLFISEDNKTAKPRGIPIAASVRTVLDELPGGRFKRSGFVFLNDEGNDRTAARERSRVSKRTKAAAKAAKLDGVTFHTLRHTAGSWMAQPGQSQVQIARCSDTRRRPRTATCTLGQRTSAVP
jgi:integrase